ncbi:MAG: D-tyrosyl-tRNA(Tyr) deacylase [Flavobacteriales bacterium]|nr:D-tyrosyl-tRNA(Tyr) deacylase [Flavobacteriales bacterium]
MRAVIQRVSHAEVRIQGKVSGSIEQGLMILLGVEHEDTEEDLKWLARKTGEMRIFSDADGLMNLSLIDVDGEALVVSQFTLHAKYKKGKRPSFIRAAKPDQAVPMYEQFAKELGSYLNKPVQTGEFGADMQLELVNEGPVTMVLDTKNKE